MDTPETKEPERYLCCFAVSVRNGERGCGVADVRPASAKEDRQHGRVIHDAVDHVCRQSVGDGGQRVGQCWGGHTVIVM